MTANRSATQRKLKMWAANDAEALRRVIFSPEWRKLFLAAFKDRLEKKTEDGVRMYAEAVRLVGNQVTLHQTIIQQFGTTEEHAKKLVARGREMEQLNEEERMGLCEQALVEYYRRDPRALAKSPLREVVGLLPVAEEVNGEAQEGLPLLREEAPQQ